jgi:microcystin-dependent protein
VSEPFVAEVRIYACNFAPRGWAFCNGQLLPIAQNTTLFSLIGTTYGGDGRTTMALPNLQGRAPMHPGRGPGLTDRRLGERSGDTAVGLGVNQIPSHTHATQYFNNAPATTGIPSSSATLGVNDSQHNYGPALDTVSMAEPTFKQEGGGQPHNNMQPYLGMNFVIALVGLYPSRS